MIITRLAGGVGNQMFHYAVAKGYQRNENEEIILDDHLLEELVDDIEQINQRPFALHIFSNLKAKRSSKKFNHIIAGKDFIAKVERKLFWLVTTHVKQKLMEPLPIVPSKKKYIYLEGNFQSENYFKSFKPQLIEDFRFPQLDEVNEIFRKKILSTPDALSLHIRRGDYLGSFNSKIFTSVNIDYYHNAIDIIADRLKLERVPTFIFTDDITWAKENFKSTKLDIHFGEYNYGHNSWKDMFLMTCCQHHIIANSSFSWWGAWLSQRNGLKMAPKYWYRPNSWDFDIDDIVPKSWTIVDYKLD